nr:hypothetical protein [Paraburkholderia lacunae]
MDETANKLPRGYDKTNDLRPAPAWADVLRYSQRAAVQREAADAIASRRFRGDQLPVGGFRQFICAESARWLACDASGADRQGAVSESMRLDPHVLDPTPDGPRQAFRTRGRDVAEHDTEFVATVSRDKSTRSRNDSGNTFRNRSQHLVAHLVAQRVVEALEGVDVYEQDGQRDAFSLCRAPLRVSRGKATQSTMANNFFAMGERGEARRGTSKRTDGNAKPGDHGVGDALTDRFEREKGADQCDGHSRDAGENRVFAERAPTPRKSEHANAGVVQASGSQRAELRAESCVFRSFASPNCGLSFDSIFCTETTKKQRCPHDFTGCLARSVLPLPPRHALYLARR